MHGDGLLFSDWSMIRIFCTQACVPILQNEIKSKFSGFMDALNVKFDNFFSDSFFIIIIQFCRKKLEKIIGGHPVAKITQKVDCKKWQKIAFLLALD